MLGPDLDAPGSGDVVADIFRCLGSRYPLQAQQGVAALRALPAADAERVVLRALNHPLRRMRRNAATAVPDLGSEAATLALLDLLQDDRTLLFSCQQAVQRLASPAQLARISRGLRQPLCGNRKLYAMLLGEIPAESSLPGLLEALASSHRGVRDGALHAFRYGHPSLRQPSARAQLLVSLSQRLRPAPLLALGMVKAPELVPLVEPLLRDTRVAVSIRLAAVEALAEVGGDRAAEALVIPLRDPRPGLLGDAVAEALRRLKSPAVVGELMAALDSRYPEVRWRAVTALDYVPQAAVRLATLLVGERDVHVRRAAARLLGELRLGDTWQALAALLPRDPDRHVRWNSAWALGRLAQGAAVESLVKLLASRSPFVRHLAAEALGGYGAALQEFPSAIEALVNAAGDLFPAVSHSAAWALRQVDLAQALKILKRLRQSPTAAIRLRARCAETWLAPRFASYTPHFPIKSSRTTGLTI